MSQSWPFHSHASGRANPNTGLAHSFLPSLRIPSPPPNPTVRVLTRPTSIYWAPTVCARNERLSQEDPCLLAVCSGGAGKAGSVRSTRERKVERGRAGCRGERQGSTPGQIGPHGDGLGQSGPAAVRLSGGWSILGVEGTASTQGRGRRRLMQGAGGGGRGVQGHISKDQGLADPVGRGLSRLMVPILPKRQLRSRSPGP